MTSQSAHFGNRNQVATRSPELDFALVLARVIGAMSEDPAQLRGAVYELARIKLQREAWHRDPPMDLLEMRRLMLSLEGAIEGVETVYAKHDELRALQSLDRLIESSGFGPAPMVIGKHSPLMVEAGSATTCALDLPVVSSPRPARPTLREALSWPNVAPFMRGAMVGLLALALCGVLGRQFGWFERPLEQAPPAATVAQYQKVEAPAAVPVALASLQPVAPPQQQAAGVPLPSVYGVYAVNAGQLYELQPLVGRVPDPRVMVSSPIQTPSQTVLADGNITFIIYRRDIASSVPERVTVRVIAKIVRTMKFTSAGQASLARADDGWAIRNVSHELRVAPLRENSEMLLVKPEDAGFVFSPGRYGLVLKGQAYDFTVAGAATDSAQCLERIEAANGAFFSECRKPR
jgi:hypothetical protein